MHLTFFFSISKQNQLQAQTSKTNRGKKNTPPPKEAWEWGLEEHILWEGESMMREVVCSLLWVGKKKGKGWREIGERELEWRRIGLFI
jgi:hypothetical protein